MSRVSTKMTVTTIGGYAILAKLGRSTHAAVYRGQHLQTGKDVAIKVMAPQLTSSPALQQRFVQECKVAYQLDHPHIVRVVDYGMEGMRAYLVMEFVDGGTLADLVEQRGRMPEAQALRLIGEVGRALHWAHQRRLVHRNVKPDNILLTAAGQAKLSGLGLVKDLQSTENLTQSQSVLGTPHYMAPDQFEDPRKADAQSDIYSLAATLYTALCADLPFKSSSLKDVLGVYRKQMSNEVVHPQKLAPELSDRTSVAILAGLRARREERPATVLDFLAALGEPAVAGVRASVAVVSHVKHDPGSLDRRGNKRFPSRRVTNCFALARTVGKSWRGRVVNISETGVCLELTRRFEPGTMLTFAIEGPAAGRQSLVIRVKWVRQAAGTAWHLGCQFDRPLGDGEVDEMIAQQE